MSLALIRGVTPLLVALSISAFDTTAPPPGGEGPPLP